MIPNTTRTVSRVRSLCCHSSSPPPSSPDTRQASSGRVRGAQATASSGRMKRALWVNGRCRECLDPDVRRSVSPRANDRGPPIACLESEVDGREEEKKGQGGCRVQARCEPGRLENGLREAGDWYLWGPYLSERQWGTVREDYSADGTAWEYLPHDHARSRAYRWGEDGLAGFCDVEQRLCLGLALWNGRDPILKERIFGLTGNQGNHGEDAKEYWWYLDATPSHSWNRWRYHYPQREFPYARPGRRRTPPRQARPRVRAARHRRLRRRPLLDRRGRLREGRPARPAA